ncbi:hypothetical protein CTAYLR_009419 [Chrysophaeum taylorii]|uniref:PH domain-containing protein n=1 Tax=Chrysophaeum taylorii TaxID=2483200 RepID=A0AAD7UL36_9STRA|nr:hypothetical protein CTAYLR_009419 [Chrysophaeum taylorii]
MSCQRRACEDNCSPGRRSIAALIRSFEDQLVVNSPNPWIREPHGYLLKPDFRRPEQLRRNYSESSKSPSEGSSGLSSSTSSSESRNLFSTIQRSLAPKHYARRYFRLEGARKLAYYRSVTDRCPIGEIDLSQVEFIQFSRIKDAPTHAVDLVSRERVFTLGADTREDLAHWCVALCRAMRDAVDSSEAPCWKQYDDVYYEGADVKLELEKVLLPESDERDNAAADHPPPEHARSASNLLQHHEQPLESNRGRLARSASEKEPSRRNSKGRRDVEPTPPRRESKWFAVVTKVFGDVAKRGVVRPADILLGVNDTAFETFEEAASTLETAKFPITLRLARDVGASLVAEGWALVGGRLRYLELSRKWLNGTRPIPGGEVADSPDFGYDISIIDAVEPDDNNPNAIVVELANDPNDNFRFELATSAEAKAWLARLETLVALRHSAEDQQHQKRPRRGSSKKDLASPLVAGQTSSSSSSSSSKRRFSSPLLSPFRKSSKTPSDLAAVAGQLQKELALSSTFPFDDDDDDDERSDGDDQDDGDDQADEIEDDNKEWPSPLDFNGLVTPRQMRLPPKGCSEDRGLTCFAATLREHGRTGRQSRSLLFAVTTRDKEALFFAQDDDTETALGQIDLQGASVSRLDDHSCRVDVRKPVRRRVDLVFNDNPPGDPHRAARCTTLLADIADANSAPRIPALSKKLSDDVELLGELGFRVVLRGDVYTPWANCFASIEHRELRLYSLPRRCLIKAPIKLNTIVRCCVLDFAPHRFELELHEDAPPCTLLFRFQAASTTGAASIASAIALAARSDACRRH